MRIRSCLFYLMKKPRLGAVSFMTQSLATYTAKRHDQQ